LLTLGKGVALLDKAFKQVSALLLLNPMEKSLENPRINGLWLSKC